MQLFIKFISGIPTQMDGESGLAVGKRVGNYAVLRAEHDGTE
jgi:hypothetical protein